MTQEFIPRWPIRATVSGASKAPRYRIEEVGRQPADYPNFNKITMRATSMPARRCICCGAPAHLVAHD